MLIRRRRHTGYGRKKEDRNPLYYSSPKKSGERNLSKEGEGKT